MMGRLAAVIAAVLALAGPAAANDLGVLWERFLGRYAEQSLVSGSGRDDDPLLRRWLDQVGGEVAASSPRLDIRPRFHVLASDAPNAFALPGGAVYVTRGLLDLVRSDDELAGVLAHETAHVRRGDAAKQLGANLLAAVLIDRVAGGRREVRTGLVVANLLRSLAGSQSAELRADGEGVSYLRAGGYDPAGLAAFLERLAGGKTPVLGEYLASHPGIERRLTALRAMAPQETSEDTRAAWAAGLRRRGLWNEAALIERGEAAPTPVELVTPVPERLAARERVVVQRSGATRRGLDGARRAPRTGGALQPALLATLPVDDWRWLYLSAHATALQGRVGDVLARTGRLLAVAPQNWRNVAALEETSSTAVAIELAQGRTELETAVELAGGVPRALERAARATAAALWDVNTRFGARDRSRDWLRIGALEGLLRYAESELSRADRAAAKAWRLESLARIRFLVAALDRTVVTEEAHGRWLRLAERRLGVAPDPTGPAGVASVRTALAVQLGKNEADVEAGRTEPWAEWIVTRGGLPENIATVLQMLMRDLQREEDARAR